MTRSLPFLVLMALIAGAATIFAFAPWRNYWLMPVSLAILCLLLQRNPRHAFQTGYGWGFGAYLANFWWIWNSLHDVAGLPAFLAGPLVLLLPAWLAIWPGLAAWGTMRIGKTRALRCLLAFPASWTLTEWLRSWMLTGFPWGQAGYSQITESPLAGFAPVAGIYGITFAVALTAGALALLYKAERRERALLLGLIVLLLAGGQWLKALRFTEPVGKPLSVALAQGNIAQSMKWDPARSQETLALYYQQVATTRADLMLLPETALTYFLDDLPSGYLTMLTGDAARHDMAVALGIPRRTADGTGYLNAVVAVTEPGQPFYAKNHLVPLGEYIPFPALLGWIYQFMHMPMSGFTAGGPDQSPIPLAGQQIAFNICYEDSFGEELIGPARQSTMLANVSNLAWFGSSSAASLHMQMAQARALETGRFMLRSTNTGMTAIIRPDGDIAAIAAPNTRQVLTGFAQGMQGDTPYMRTGNLPVLLLSASLLMLSALPRLIARFRQKPAP